MSALVQLLRPTQWSKNVFLLAGLVFGQKLGDVSAVAQAAWAFGCFCLLSSSAYIVNDIRDADEDRLHPTKRTRPIAAGRISRGTALLYCALVLAAGLAASAALGRAFLAVGVGYLLLQAAYNLRLKQEALLDVIVLGTGFVLRAVAGAVAVGVDISHWLVLCTFTLCLFMGFSKRRCELNAMTEKGEAARHRATLAIYTPELLNHMTTVTAGIAVVSFMLYTTDERTIKVFHTHNLIYTLPFVFYAIFRFALLVEHGKVDGPTTVLLRDRPFQAALVLWAAAVLLIIYGGEGWLARFGLA